MRAALFILLLNVVGMTKGYAYFWFSARCSTGQMLYYNFNGTSSVELTYPGHLHSVMDSFYGYDGWDGFDKPMGNIILPDSVQYDGVYYSVTSIGEWAFSRCSSLTSIEIPNSVSHIGRSAFYCCNSLTSIGIPNSVTYIDDFAFGYTSLTSIVIPNTVTDIGINPFCCSGLEQIIVDEGNAYYDSRGNCNAIINSSTSELISGCKNTVIPNSVTSIKMEAFLDCTGLTSIEIPSSVTYIGDAAFYRCTGLTSVEIPNSVTSIREETFYGCSGLTSIEIPNSVTSIGNAAFYGCTGLTSMTVWANNHPALGSDAFDGVDKSIPVYIPVGSLEDYQNAGGWNEFTYFVELITFADAYVKALCVGKWDTDDDDELSYAEAAAVPSLENVFNGKSSITSFNELQYFIGLTSIGSHEFYNCRSLNSITIPNSVTSIDNSAFSGCSGLGQIIVDSENSVYDSRDNCNAIIYTSSNLLVVGCKNTVIPNSVTSIGDLAFYHCTGLTTIAIPNSVTSIGNAAFYGCTGLTSMSVLAVNPPELGSDAFHGVDISIPVYVPCGSLEDYQNADGWNGFTSIKALCPGEVSVTINPSEGGTVTGTGYYNGGELCVLTAIPNLYYSFGYWTENGNVVSTNAQYTFTVTGNRTLVANFSESFVIGGENSQLICNGTTYLHNYLPSHSSSQYSFSEQIYTAEELGDAGLISSIAFYNEGAEAERKYDIYLKYTTKSCFSNTTDWEIMSDYDKVFSGYVYMQANDWTVITFNTPFDNTPFDYDGHTNVILAVDDNTGNQTPMVRCRTFSTNERQAIFNYGFTDIDPSDPNYDPNGPAYMSRSIPNRKNQIIITKTTKSDYLPSCSYYKYAFSQQIYTTDELGDAGYISVIGFYNDGAEKTRIYDIYMKPTQKEKFDSNADWESVSASNLVFSGSVTMRANDWTYITFNTPFAYDGNTNVVLVVDDKTGSYDTSPNMNCHVFDSDETQAIYIYNNDINYDPSSPAYTGTMLSKKNQLFVAKVPFSAPTFNVSVSANPTEGGTVSGVGTYSQGQTCTLTATANEGYEFVNWTENGEVVSTEAEYTFIVTGDRNLVANFTQPSFHFTTTGNWSQPSNWCGNALPGAEDEVIIDANCTLDVDAEVTTLTVSEGQTLTLQSGKTLTVSDTLTNATIGGLVIEDGGQLYHNNAGVMATVEKNIAAYTANDNGWNFIASPMVSSIEPTLENGFLANEYDLYYYDEPYHYWRNHKMSSNSQNPGFDIEPQMGYLYANDEGTTLKFLGELQPSNEDVTIGDLSHEASTLTSFNLVGNPFACNATIDLPAFVISGRSVVAYTEGMKTLGPCEGVMVQADAMNGSVTFTKVNPTESASQPNQMQITVAQQSMSKGAEYDNVIINFKDGNRLEKFDLGTDAAKVYIPVDGKDYAIITSEKTGELPLNFKAMRNGEYTISVNPEGVDLDYLHLIDNLTGADMDLLTSPTYTFTAKTTDYSSRFRLVFSVSGNADDDDATFAFFSNGNIIIIGAEAGATLQIVDMQGRVVVSCGGHTQCVPTSGMAKGVYVLRLIEMENVRTQKMVIE